MAETGRCDGNKKHFEAFDNYLEISCNSRFCGKRPGVVVIHQFDRYTLQLIGTRMYKDPLKGEI